MSWLWKRRGTDGEAAAEPFVPEGRKDVLFVYDEPHAGSRYRSGHQAEQLRLVGGTSDAVRTNRIDLAAAFDHYDSFVLNRVSWSEAVETFLERVRSSGKRVTFDTDDLVFEPEVHRHLAFMETWPEESRQAEMGRMDSLRRTLEACGRATVSTQPLADAAARRVPDVEVVHNVVSDEMVTLADEALSSLSSRNDDVTVAYLSGTGTHNRDFLEAADAVLWALETYPQVRFLAVGKLQLDGRFDRFGSRVTRLPLQPWHSLPGVLAGVDVNLAPLEPNNPFTECKSCVKYLEASLLSVPTLASGRPDFLRVIDHDRNGLIAESAEDWREGLARLVESSALRYELGARARDDVLRNHTTRAGADRTRAANESASERLRRAEETIGELERDLTIWRARAELAETNAAQWEVTQRRSLWRVFMRLDQARSRLAPPGSLRDTSARGTARLGARALDAIGGRRTSQAARSSSSPKDVLLLYEHASASSRYRCDHYAEELASLGVSLDVASCHDFDLTSAVDSYGCFVLHRVRWGDEVASFIDRVHARGKTAIFDTDDLIFEPRLFHHFAALDAGTDDERSSWVKKLNRYRRLLQECDGAIVSTEALAVHARELNSRVEVVHNVVSDEMVRLADEALSSVSPRNGGVTVAYLSGTGTHNRDFLEAADAVLWALDTYPEVRFLAVGELQLDGRFDRFGSRVTRLPLQPWRSLPGVLTGVDVNLAPLEPNNPVTECKSCVKYLEAAVLRVPTIASPRPDFVRVVEPGVNGLLAETPDEWRDALERLIGDPGRRVEIGALASADVRRNHTTRSAVYPTRAQRLTEMYRRIG
jgi:glycosyltransferase involved in cell wall biosynthesis